MNFFTFTKLGRTLLLTAVLVVGSACWLGCGGNDNPTNNNGNSNNGGNNNSNNSGGGSAAIGKWMKQNLNVETADSWCYNNDPANCAIYGRLYTWEAAKKACQSVGKRLPTRAEWEALVTAVGNKAGKKLKATSGWDLDGNGTNDYGFSALPGGSRVSSGGFILEGVHGNWWTATEYSDKYAYKRVMSSYSDYASEFYDNDKREGYSVRCVAD